MGGGLIDDLSVHNNVPCCCTSNAVVLLRGRLHLFNKKMFVLFVVAITFFSLSTVQKILLSKCCLFCLLSNGI